MNLTLRHKVNGAIIITFFLIALLFAAIQISVQQHRFQRTIQRIEVLLHTLVERDREQLANEIFDDRIKAIRIRIKEMHRVEGILSISVFDNKGLLLASDGTGLTQQNINSEESRNIHQQALMEKKSWQGETSLLFSREISFLGDMLGYIRIQYSLEELEADQRIFFRTFAGLLITILAVMLVVLNLILSRAILHPIRYLRDATQHIAEGNLEKDIEMDRRDELGNLADSFRKMKIAIKEKISDLERITGIIESTSDLVAVGAHKGKIIYLNKAGRKMLGWGDTESLEKMQFKTIHPQWATELIVNEGIPMARAKGIWEGETALKGADGREIPVSQVIISHSGVEGKPDYISTIMRDISEPKRTEEELRYLRNYLTGIIDSMPSILIGIDKDGKVTQWNEQARKATGLSSAEALGQPFEKVLPSLSKEKERIYEAMLNQHMLSDPKQVLQTKEAKRYQDLTVYPLISGGREGAVIRIDDVTDKVKMEEMMIQSEKMLSVGGLAAGMAHEINNPLAGMMQTANVLTNRLTNEKMLANREAAKAAGISMESISTFAETRMIPKLLQNIIESGVRASEIVTNMLSFSRKSDTVSASYSLAGLLDQTVDLAGSDYNLKKKFDFRKIEIVREYDENLPNIPCDSGQIQQVLLNLLRNGAEAMQENREESGVSRFFLRLIREQEKDLVRIEIEDNGPGMDEEVRKRVLEPFFTTKPTGSGTGLGLSVSYFIITENHGGSMTVETMPGKGARFIIRLPLKRA
jgi:PAS domain S-box-containing protein